MVCNRVALQRDQPRKQTKLERQGSTSVRQESRGGALQHTHTWICARTHTHTHTHLEAGRGCGGGGGDAKEAGGLGAGGGAGAAGVAQRSTEG